MKKANYLLALAGLIVGFTSAEATTVIPPTFDQLVGQAEFIFQGNVTKLNAQWIGEGADRHIVSYVTFNVKEALKGTPGQTYTIRMFGGTVEGESMGIADAPTFQVGDEDILFVENNGSQVIPLVGIMHGRFHVRRDSSGGELVTTNEEEPLRNISSLGGPRTASYAEAILTPAGFKAAIRSKLQGGHPQN
ncbi:MAG: hypothetical protein QOH39_1399 [Verrucomicrobiota bacterium]|jgi:hypothetical protein